MYIWLTCLRETQKLPQRVGSVVGATLEQSANSLALEARDRRRAHQSTWNAAKTAARDRIDLGSR